MLAHLSSTSPYVCDLSRGPIELANRMASVVQSKKISMLLEQKESLSKQSRTPLKLLSPEEVPFDTTASANDVDASIQPIWYSEQTIDEEQTKSSNEESEDIAAIIREQQRNPSICPTSLSPIESQYSSVMEDLEAPTQPSLMHKSSTFTIEHESCTSTDSQSNESEKENSLDPNSINPPTDDSFRALEHLLGLGSATTTVRESPKTNHDTLSLTVVTPTDIINATANTSRASFLPKSGEDSAPSSQTIAPMPTIESMDSTMPPSFLAENTVIDDEAQSQPTESQEINEETPEIDSIKDDSNTDDDTNFSFELNDFGNNSKEELSSTESVPSAVETTPVQIPVLNIRAPTCADVAFRALIKPRTGGRVSQPVKAQSPLANQNKNRSSAPTSRLLRSSCRRALTESSGNKSTVESEENIATDCLVNESKHNVHSLVQIVTLPEEDEQDHQDETNSVTLNLTNTNDVVNQSSTSSLETQTSTTPTEEVMPLLSREYTFNSPDERTSKRVTRRTTLNQIKSNVNDEIRTSIINETKLSSVDQTTMTDVDESVSSSNIPSPSMLGVLLTNVEEPSSPKIASKSMLGVLLTNESEPSTPKTILPRKSIRQTRQSVRISTPQGFGMTNIDPLHSSTPSVSRRHSVQMVSIGAEEQVSITVAQPMISERNEDVSMQETTPIEEENLVQPEEVPVEENVSSTEEVPVEENVSSTEEVPVEEHVSSTEQMEEEEIEEEVKIEMIPLNDTVPVPTVRTMEIGIQTTPSLDLASRRVLSTIEQQTTPQIQNKAIIQLQRNVRFQLTPTTDARLAEKEKLEEKLRGLKPDIVIPPATNPLDEENQNELGTAKKNSKGKSKKNETKKRVERSRSRSPKVERKVTRRQSKEKTPEVQEETTTKIVTRKRANAKSVEPICQPTEPLTKRAKPSKNEMKRVELDVEKPKTVLTVRSSSSNRPRTRSRSTSKSSKNLSIVEPEKSTIEFEKMTVAALKSQLNSREISIPKGAKKSDLVALLSNVETKSNRKEKKSEMKERVSSIALRTRHRKN